MEEANEEAEHKGFCDTELSTNKQTRDAKSEEAQELTAEKDKLTADIQMLSNQIATLGKEIAELDAAMAKATEARQVEKEKNEVTISDARAAQAATSQAMAVLKEFYDKAAGGSTLPQESVEPEGDINWDKRALTYIKTGGAGALVQSA